MLPQSIGSKTVANLANLGAGALIAAVSTGGSSLLVAAAVAGCVGCLAIWSYWGAKETDQAEADAQSRFRALMREQDGLKGALRKIAAGQTETEMFAADKARELLAFIEAAERDRRAASQDHEQLLVYLARKIEENFAETGEKIEQLHEALAEYSAGLMDHIEISRAEIRQFANENKVAHERQAEDSRSIQESIAQLSARNASAPLDGHAEIEAAVAELKKRSYAVARDRLQRLRQRNYDALGPRERFRLFANLAIIAE